MAKNDNLKDFLTDVADAIRAKKGSNSPINPQNFSSEIASIGTDEVFETILITLSTDDGTEPMGQVVTIDNREFLWEGETIVYYVVYGKDYTISVDAKDGYLSPSSVSFIASQSYRNINLQYKKDSAITTICIDQTITDPTSMISGDINGVAIQLIRSNSHRYLGKYTSNGTMTICQLDDSDSTKYADGTDAILTGEEGDVFMKLPRFAYKAKEKSTDVWEISFVLGDALDSEWVQWDGIDLIGAYEGTILNSKARSISNVGSTGGNSITAWQNAIKGEGFSLVKLKHQNIMAFLAYASLGTTNVQSVIGFGTNSYSKTNGQTNVLGMSDTVAGQNGDSQSINFWGLENWWGNKGEWVGNVKVNGKTISITEDDGTTRTVILPNIFAGRISKMLIGSYLDTLATECNGSDTTGYCDYFGNNSTGERIMRRSGDHYKPTGGVAYADCGATSSTRGNNFGSRIAFRGTIIEEKSVETFKALTEIE